MKMKIIGLGIILVLLGAIMYQILTRREVKNLKDPVVEKAPKVESQVESQPENNLTNAMASVEKSTSSPSMNTRKIPRRYSLTEEQVNTPYVPQAGQISLEKATAIATKKFRDLSPNIEKYYSHIYHKIYSVDGFVYVEFDDYEQEKKMRESNAKGADYIYLVIMDAYSGEVVMELGG